MKQTASKTPATNKSSRIFRRILKIAAWTVALPIILVLLLAIALYLPPVQNWAVGKATEYASEQTGMDITIGYVRLACPLDLKVEDVSAVKRDTVPPCEIAKIRSIYVDVQFLPLLDGTVNIDAMEMSGMKVNTADIIDAAIVKGTLKTLSLKSHGVDLLKEMAQLDKVKIDGADLDVWINDSVPEDSTEKEPVSWKIKIQQAEMRKSSVRLRGNGLDVYAGIGRLKAENALIDLLKPEYQVAHAELKDGSLKYALNPALPIEETPIQLSGLFADIDSIRFLAPTIAARINRIGTPHSSLRAAINMDLTAFDSDNPGQLRMALEGSIGKEDLMLGKSFLPLGTLEKLPDSPLCIVADVNGNSRLLNINNLLVRMPGVASLNANGRIQNPLDVKQLSTELFCTLDMPDIGIAARFLDPKILATAGFSIPYGLPLKASMDISGGMNRLGIENLALSIPGRMDLKMKGHVLSLDNLNNLRTDICLSLKAPNIDFITACISPQKLKQFGVRLPKGIGVSGDVCMRGDNYGIDLLLTEGGGRVKLQGDVDLAAETYDVDAQISNLAVSHFLPTAGIGRLTTSLKAKGKDFDVMSKHAVMKANGNISQLHIGSQNLKGIDLSANIKSGYADALINCKNEFMNGYANAQFLLSTEIVKGTLAAEVADIDFNKLGISEKLVRIGLCSHLDIDYNFKKNVTLKGMVSDLVLKGEKKTFYPADIVFDFVSRNDSTRAVLDCGDLHAHFRSIDSYIDFTDKINALSVIVDSIVSQKRLDLNTVWAALPEALINFEAGQENPLSRFLLLNGVKYNKFGMRFRSSPKNGINGSLDIHGFKKDSLLLDTIFLNLKSGANTCEYFGKIRNNKNNPDFTFNALFRGRLLERSSNLGLVIYDKDDKMGVRVGLEASLLENGTQLRFSREHPILGYKKFTVNKDNYIIMTSDNRITADMKLKGEDGMGISIYTDDENTEALQDITVSLQNFNLKEILSSIPYAPNMAGILNGDYHAIIENDEARTISVSSSTSISKLEYEDLTIGDISSDFVYMPDTAGTHHIDGVLYMNDEEICSVMGAYSPEGDGQIEAKMKMHEMPLHMANGFIPNQIIGFKGKGDGELTIEGSLKKPVVNGEVFLDSCHMFSVPYGVDMRFSNDPVRIIDSRLMLENFEMYSYNNSPLNMMGYVDFSDLENMKMSVRMKASNFMLINSKENMRSEAYGKAYVDFEGSINGPMDNLTMMGRLNVLPATDLSYILRDSPLTTDSHLDELVKFVNLNDSVAPRVSKPAITGFNMTMGININKSAHVVCFLNTDHSNYVDLVGGGSLTMKYNPANDLTLTGRYSLAGGEMKYSLPIIPLKTFDIKDGSYVEFTGDIMNPRLNITATEKVKAQVSNRGGGDRSVDFECGVVITKTLQDMGLEFTLDAPEDFEMSSDLKTMSADLRGKLAVTMLTTGMYLADGNTNNFTMNSALNQFLQGEINNITGNALRTLDLSLGMDNTTDQSGNTHMDYSFKFSKRFLNNRLKVTIGGIVSTGNNIERGQNNSVFDNVSVEYMLDRSGSKYLNFYYDHNSYDWLDGNVQKFGGGFTWKRSMLRFRDIINFKQEKPAAPKDSLSKDSLTKI